MKTILSFSGFALSLVMATAAETNSPGLTSDRVGFPTNYAKSYEVLRMVPRDEGKKLVTVYGNRAAASVTNRTQLPYPNGSVLVMETAGTVKDTSGQPARDAAGNLVKEKVLGLHVMRREMDFGVAYAEKRSGEWEFVEYRADGSYLTPPEKSATCAECHIKAGAEKDFVYHGRLGDIGNK